MENFLEWKCRSKIRYKTRQRAWQGSLFYFKKLGTYATPYKCKNCKKFHLTGKNAQPTPSKEFINEFNKWFGSEAIPHYSSNK